MYRNPETYYVEKSSLEEFTLGMLALGRPLETSLVGVFETGDKVRGSRKDVDLPMHRDGEYSQKLAEVQGGTYVAKEGIDIVGLYCINEGEGRCVTLVEHPLGIVEIELKKGEALVFDNHKVMHGRRGPVGDRILMRMWVQRTPGG
jgi:hypothetical protein